MALNHAVLALLHSLGVTQAPVQMCLFAARPHEAVSLLLTAPYFSMALVGKGEEKTFLGCCLRPIFYISSTKTPFFGNGEVQQYAPPHEQVCTSMVSNGEEESLSEGEKSCSWQWFHGVSC